MFIKNSTLTVKCDGTRPNCALLGNAFPNKPNYQQCAAIRDTFNLHKSKVIRIVQNSNENSKQKKSRFSIMKLLTLHKRNSYIRYKHTICSWAAIFVFLATIITVIFPFYIAFYLFNDIWSQYKIVYEHPDVRFQYKYIFVAEYSASQSSDVENSFDSSVTTCSSYEYLNRLFEDYSECSMIKVSASHSIFFVNIYIMYKRFISLVLGKGFRFRPSH